MINVIASIRIKAGRREEFVAVFKSNVANVLQEEGCIEYVPTIDVQTGLAAQDLDANLVTIIEKWESVDALKAHLSAPHMIAYAAKVKDLVEDRSIRILSEA